MHYNSNRTCQGGGGRKLSLIMNSTHEMLISHTQYYVHCTLDNDYRHDEWSWYLESVNETKKVYVVACSFAAFGTCSSYMYIM